MFIVEKVRGGRYIPLAGSAPFETYEEAYIFAAQVQLQPHMIAGLDAVCIHNRGQAVGASNT